MKITIPILLIFSLLSTNCSSNAQFRQNYTRAIVKNIIEESFSGKREIEIAFADENHLKNHTGHVIAFEAQEQWIVFKTTDSGNAVFTIQLA